MFVCTYQLLQYEQRTSGWCCMIKQREEELWWRGVVSADALDFTALVSPTNHAPKARDKERTWTGGCSFSRRPGRAATYLKSLQWPLPADRSVAFLVVPKASNRRRPHATFLLSTRPRRRSIRQHGHCPRRQTRSDEAVSAPGLARSI